MIIRVFGAEGNGKGITMNHEKCMYFLCYLKSAQKYRNNSTKIAFSFCTHETNKIQTIGLAGKSAAICGKKVNKVLTRGKIQAEKQKKMGKRKRSRLDTRHWTRQEKKKELAEKDETSEYAFEC